jgi:ribonuclease P protein component
MEGPQISNKFQKEDRLYSRKSIELLFEKGKVHHINPFRLVFKISEGNPAGGLVTLVAVPKKQLKRSVDRNRMKRLMREAFRTRNHALKSYLMENKVFMELAIVYTSKKLLSFASVDKGMIMVLNYLLDLANSGDLKESVTVTGSADNSIPQLPK